MRQPGRLRLLAGKWLALLGLVGATGLVATVAAVVAALAVAPSQGIDTADWTTSSGFADMASAAGNTALAMAGYGTVGVALAILLRTPVAANGVGLAWLIPGEAIPVRRDRGRRPVAARRAPGGGDRGRKRHRGLRHRAADARRLPIHDSHVLRRSGSD